MANSKGVNRQLPHSPQTSALLKYLQGGLEALPGHENKGDKAIDGVACAVKSD